MKRNKKQDLRVEGKKVTSGKIAIQEGQIYFYPKGSENEPIFTNVCDCIAVVILMKNGDKYCYHKYYRDAPLKIIQEFEKFNIDKDQIERIAFFGGALRLTDPVTGDKLGVQKHFVTTLEDDGSFKIPKFSYSAQNGDLTFTVLPSNDYNPKDKSFSVFPSINHDPKDKYESIYTADGKFYPTECNISFRTKLEKKLLNKKTGTIKSKPYFEGVLKHSKLHQDSSLYVRKDESDQSVVVNSFKVNKPDHFVAYRNIKVLTKILKSLYGNDIVDKVFHFNTKEHNNIIIDKNNKAIISDTDTSTFKEPFFKMLDPEEQSRRDATLKAETIERWASDSSIYSAENNIYRINMNKTDAYQIYPNKKFLNTVDNKNELPELLGVLDFANAKRDEDNSYMVNLVNQQLELEREQKDSERLSKEPSGENKKEKKEKSKIVSRLSNFFRRRKRSPQEELEQEQEGLLSQEELNRTPLIYLSEEEKRLREEEAREEEFQKILESSNLFKLGKYSQGLLAQKEQKDVPEEEFQKILESSNLFKLGKYSQGLLAQKEQETTVQKPLEGHEEKKRGRRERFERKKERRSTWKSWDKEVDSNLKEELKKKKEESEEKVWETWNRRMESNSQEEVVKEEGALAKKTSDKPKKVKRVRFDLSSLSPTFRDREDSLKKKSAEGRSRVL